MQGRTRAGVAAAVLAAALAVAAPALAADYTVTGLGDDTSVACSDATTCPTIRQALSLATDFPGSTIHVPAGTTQLNSALTVGTSATIIGTGARGTVIHAAAADRVFVVNQGENVAFEGLTMSGGTDASQTGGGNLLAGDSSVVSLDHVHVTGGNAATLGGGIFDEAAAQLTIDKSLIDGNKAGQGGGIYSVDNPDHPTALTIRDSTITGNSAQQGGGIETGLRAAQLARVTIAGNSATNAPGGGLLILSGAVSVTGSIVASNSGLVGRTVGPSDCGTAAPVDAGANVESATTCGFTRADDRQNVDPGLGALTNAGGQTDTLPLAATSPAIDLAGACGPAADQRDVARPQGLACDAGAYELVPAPPPPPPPPPGPTPTPTPTPAAGHSVVVRTVDGTIRVRRPGSSAYVVLDATQGIPVGSTVDSRDGEVLLTALITKGGHAQTARFFDGIFKVTQTHSTTDLTLTESLASCRTVAHSAATKKKKKKPTSRKLWGDGSGSFRTRGQYSAATVRGTEWLVQDTCSGTLTRVKHGVVSVRDAVRHRTVLLRAGKHYLARPKQQ